MNASKRVTDDEIGVEPPPETRVKLLRAVDVGNRDDDGLKLQIYRHWVLTWLV